MSLVRELAHGLVYNPLSGFVVCAFPFAVWNCWFGWRTYRWARTTGRLTDSYWHVSPGYSEDSVLTSLVAYEYQVDGVMYRAKRIAYRTLSGAFDSRASFDLLLAQRPLIVYHDPGRPARSVLRQGTGPLEVGFAIAAVVVASAFAYLQVA
jgi:hypothetical protein